MTSTDCETPAMHAFHIVTFSIVLGLSLLLTAPAMAADEDESGFSFRVTCQNPVMLGRTNYEFPGNGKVVPAYEGAKIDLLSINLGSVSGVKQASDHSLATYANGTLLVSRLSPAVLVDATTTRLALDFAGEVAGVAYASGGKIATAKPGELGDINAMDQPWIVIWFAEGTAYKGYPHVTDVFDENYGPDKRFLQENRAVPLDVPILLRLEHKPTAATLTAKQLNLTFADQAGKVAVMPLFGGRTFLPDVTAKWADGLPDEAAEQAKRWSRVLRDYPLTAAETYAVEDDGDTLAVTETFTFTSFDDAWKTPAVKAAPLPAMLALSLSGEVPVSFEAGGQPVEPHDYQLMDTPGLAMGIEGVDAYTWRLRGINDYVTPPGLEPMTPIGDGVALAEQLRKHVDEMIEAGHLAPLFYLYGGLGGGGPSYLYFGRATELAHTLQAAWPWLDESLRAKALAYLKAEWQKTPPFTTDVSMDGANRAPYDLPMEQVGRALNETKVRQSSIRQWRELAELYDIDIYNRLTGESAGEDVRNRGVELTRKLLATQDWSLMIPVVRRKTQGFFQGANYWDRNGTASVNTRLAGALGMLRLARANDWPEDTQTLAARCFGQWALARVALGHYVPQLHARGLVDGEAKDDWRCVVHIDRDTALVLRGHILTVFRQDQETPPFNELVRETGLLLRRHAQDGSRIYLDNLDESMPLWYLSEAPKQSASEHRLCPLQYKHGNVLAQNWVLGRTGEAFRRYVDTTRFIGDYYYMQNLAALIGSYGKE